MPSPKKPRTVGLGSVSLDGETGMLWEVRSHWTTVCEHLSVMPRAVGAISRPTIHACFLDSEPPLLYGVSLSNGLGARLKPSRGWNPAPTGSSEKDRQLPFESNG